MSKKVKVEKLTYSDVIGLKESITMLKIETYKDSMEFNRITKVLQDQTDSFNERQSELFVKHGAVEKDGLMTLEKDNPNIQKLNKEITELSLQESVLSKKDVEFMTEEKFDWSVRTKDPIPARSMGLLAKWIVKEEKEG